jgi:hypothetical protein
MMRYDPQIPMRRIDMPIPSLDSRLDCLDGHFGRGLVHAQAEVGDLDMSVNHRRVD